MRALCLVILSAAVPSCSSTSTAIVQPTADKCTLGTSNSANAFTAQGGGGVLTITTARECSWTVASEATWITISGGQRSGQGDAQVAYSVAANPATAPRSASLLVGAERVPIAQAAAAPPAPTPAPTPPTPPVSVSVDGDVTGLTGRCPEVSFSVDRVSVTTTGATQYKKRGCTDLSNGVRVKVSGTRTSSGPVIASTIDIKKGGDDEQ